MFVGTRVGNRICNRVCNRVGSPTTETGPQAVTDQMRLVAEHLALERSVVKEAELLRR